jgi:hypothetical protein
MLLSGSTSTSVHMQRLLQRVWQTIVKQNLPG